MADIEWHRITNEAAIPKDRRLLLIGRPVGPVDIQDMETYDIFVGHWDGQQSSFVAARVPHQSSPGAKLRVSYWAEFQIPENIKLRSI
jgi:hypothetical protein